MKKLSALLLVLAASSCSGIKVMKNPPPQQESKQGITMGSPVSGGITVQKVGFWCEAKHGVLTFGNFGETEDKAKANAQEKCRNTFKDAACPIDSCKPA